MYFCVHICLKLIDLKISEEFIQNPFLTIYNGSKWPSSLPLIFSVEARTNFSFTHQFEITLSALDSTKKATEFAH